MSRSAQRLAQSGLDFETDGFEIAHAGCHCPVEWCTAHTLRHAECGDTQGDFAGGVHRGRVRRFKSGRWAGRIARELEKTMGARPSPEAVYTQQTIEDGMAMGMMEGKTRAMQRQARARARVRMTE